MSMRRKIFSSITVILLSLGFIFLSRTPVVAFLRSSVIRAFRPILEITHAVQRGLWGFTQQIGAPDVRRLQEENQRLRAREQEYQMLLDEHAALLRIVGLKEKYRAPLQGASVLLHGNEFGKEFLMLGEGTEKKIRPGNLVIDIRWSLVGIVREVGNGSAKVALASNPGEVFEVVMAPLKVSALAKGVGSRTFSLQLIPDGMSVHAGDFALMPAHLGSTGAAVAEVTRVTSGGVGAFQNIWATLIARPETLDEVFVVLE